MKLRGRGGTAKKLSAAADNHLAVMIPAVVGMSPVFLLILLNGEARQVSELKLFSSGLFSAIFAIGVALFVAQALENRRLKKLHAQPMPPGERKTIDEAIEALVPPSERSLFKTELQWRPADFTVSACIAGALDARLVVSAGLVRALRHPELKRKAEVILAHELGHIRNKDQLLVPFVSFIKTLNQLIFGSTVFIFGIARIATQLEDPTAWAVLGIIVAIGLTVVGVANVILGQLLARREYYADIVAINLLRRRLTFLRILRSSKSLPARNHPLPAQRILAILYGSRVSRCSWKLVVAALILPTVFFGAGSIGLAILLLLPAAPIVLAEIKKGFQIAPPLLRSEMEALST
jgi:Zn-dependent protease with chaperone function